MDKVHNSFIIFVFTISGFKLLLKFLDIFHKSLYTFEFSLYNIVGENIYGLLQENEKLFVAHIIIETLHFYNIGDFSLIKELNNIPIRLYNKLSLINDDVLYIGSNGKLFLVSISKMEIINIIKIEKCEIESLIFLPNKTLLTGVIINSNNFPNYCFIQFKFNDENNELK